eukprot:TRINITY_DN11432_c0_g3_i1.p1 TRINITY_DN11432_c0_g3~~TRINITY_DN11432_c0_g3_i1.p1  ORF type:complete len:371 (+),score=52.79 TRINITY_DN11432_c0_g3_i1:1099-2211(+)
MMAQLFAIVQLGVCFSISHALQKWRMHPMQTETLSLWQHEHGFTDRNQALREAGAARGLFIGSATNYHVSSGGDQRYVDLVTSQFSLITAENSCKFSPTEPELDQYHFEGCSYLLGLARAGNITFRAHNLIWGHGNPAWLTSGNFSESKLRSIEGDHIYYVTKAFGAQPYCWDVVNEALTDDPSASDPFKKVDPWYPAVDNYVQQAFREAAKAQSGFKLFYNDYGAEGMNHKSDLVYDLVQSIQKGGSRVDGVGLQMHVHMDHYPSFADVSSNIERLGKLGLEVHITEMDVSCPYCAIGNTTALEKQAAIYGGMLGACLESSNCKSFETWGVTDKYTWLNTSNHPLLFDEDYHPKPAYYEVLSRLQTYFP